MDSVDHQDLPVRDWALSGMWIVLDRLVTFGKFVGGLVLAISFGGMLYTAVVNAYTWLQVVFLLVFLILDAWVLAILFDEGRRSKMSLELIRDDVLGGLYPILALGTAFFLLAIAIFATSAVLLEERGLVDFRDPSCASPCVLDAAALSNFYTWHLTDALPLLRVNDTLHWEEPLVYEGALAGWLVLGFKLAVIIPLIQAFRIYWKLRSKTPRLRLSAWPRVTSRGGRVRVSWASVRPPENYVFHVFVEHPDVSGSDSLRDEVSYDDDPEAASQEQSEARTARDAAAKKRFGERWTAWLVSQSDIASDYVVAKPGIYKFQARWVDTTTGMESNTPRTISVHVH